MQTSILKDITPAWFARQNADIRRLVWTRCLTASMRVELWRGLEKTDKQSLLSALGVGRGRVVVRVG